MTPPLTSRRRSKAPPPGETGQEALYLKSLSDRKVPVAIKLRDGETVKGWIEYFDDGMLRLTREGKPNLFIYKHQIRTITEAGKRRGPSERLSRLRRLRSARDGPLSHSSQCPAPFLLPVTDLIFVPQSLHHCPGSWGALARFFAQGVETEYKGDVDLSLLPTALLRSLSVPGSARPFPTTASTAKRELASASTRSFAGTWIRWTEPPTSPTAFRTSASHWD